jgi:protocatechuate 3,4-dioxygenase beta subunit
MPKRLRMRTPEQILGPYFPMEISPVTSGDLTSNGKGAGHALGEAVEIGGKVLNLEGEPVRGVRIVVWQANCFGRYAHPNDRTQAPLDPNFQGFGEVRSDESGSYRIRTVKPGAYSAIDGWTRAPHVHFEVQGQFERLITQMYFPDEPLNREDRFLLSARHPDLLIAKSVSFNPASVSRILRFDIVLARG